jgi:hypothetical protein
MSQTYRPPRPVTGIALLFTNGSQAVKPVGSHYTDWAILPGVLRSYRSQSIMLAQDWCVVHLDAEDCLELFSNRTCALIMLLPICVMSTFWTRKIISWGEGRGNTKPTRWPHTSCRKFARILAEWWQAWLLKMNTSNLQMGTRVLQTRGALVTWLSD